MRSLDFAGVKMWVWRQVLISGAEVCFWARRSTAYELLRTVACWVADIPYGALLIWSLVGAGILEINVRTTLGRQLSQKNDGKDIALSLDTSKTVNRG